MMRATWPRHLGRAFLALLAFGFTPVLAQSVLDEGLDLILLVDVSGSMYENDDQEPKTGSDWQRLRWDAVKLVLDLLTDEDRIMILPFNHRTPANHIRSFPARLQSPGDPAVRRNLSDNILSLIPGVSYQVRDGGSTGILRAMQVAREEIERVRVDDAAARRPVALLLTDGEETEVAEEERQEKFEAMAAAFQTMKVPVYTFGLGDKVKPARLQLLAGKSGYYQKINDSNQLVEMFRELIWSLKGQWIWDVKPFQLKAGESKESFKTKLHDSILDFGILCYMIDPKPFADQYPKRNTFQPDPSPNITWHPPLGFDPFDRLPPRTGKQIGQYKTGHAYYYCDGRITGGDAMGTLFRRQTGEVHVEFVNVGRLTRAYFVKRTVPLFRVELEDRSFYRHEPIPVTVVMEKSAYFQPADFDVYAELTPGVDSGSAEGNSVVRVALKAKEQPIRDGRWHFVDENKVFSAATLPRSRERFDRCTLRVILQGNESRKHGLSAFRHKRPLQTILIENAIPLTHEPDRIQLEWPNELQCDVTVRTRYPYPDHLILTSQFLMPKLKTPAEDEPATSQGTHLEVSLADPSQNTRMQLDQGRATLRLQLPRSKPVGGVYQPGSMRFISADPLWPIVNAGLPRSAPDRDAYAFSIHARVGTIGLVFEPSEADVVVGPKTSRGTANIRLRTVDEDGKSAGPLTVAIRVANDQTRSFSAQELWMQPAGEPPHEEPDKRLQLLPLDRPDAVFQVFFQPDPEAGVALLGPHDYLLAASGIGYDPATMPFTPIVESPEIELERKATLVYGQPGGSTSTSLKVRLKWLHGAPYSFSLRPVSGMIFRAYPDPERQAAFVATYEGPAQPLLLESAAEGASDDAGWTELPFKLSFPVGAEPGKFGGEIQILDGEQTVANLTFGLWLNQLLIHYPVFTDDVTATFPDVPRTQLHAPDQPMRVVQYFDHPLCRSIRVENALGYKMAASNLKIEFPTGQLISRDQDVLPVPTCPDGAPIENNGLRLELQLPATPHGDPGSSYFTEVVFEYQDPDRGNLRETRQIELILLDPKTMVRRQDAASAVNPETKP
ncbi:MAG: VWA domain-containing protein, partial [Pirellulaceae bacterium]